MNVRQAKDFLVQQTVEQASIGGVSLSDLEKRMMYFTEGDASCEKPIELNEEFEAAYDTAAYEAKISRLLHLAYERLKSEDSERMRDWKLAIRTLRRGDHYLLALWDTPPSEHPVSDFLKPVGVGMLITVGIGIGIILAVKYHIDLDRILPNPHPGLTVSIFVGLLLIVILVWTRVSDWFLLRRVERRVKRGKKTD